MSEMFGQGGGRLGEKTIPKLKPGEIFCPKCKGSGKGKSWEAGGYEFSPECPKCLGDGKLDWIGRIMGKPRRLFERLEADLIDEMAKELAHEIDKEILENIMDECNKKGT
jgi:hypothetical protein